MEEGTIYLAANGAAPPTVAPPFIKFYGYCGGASGVNGWDVGIDTHNNGGGQDFYIGRVIDGSTDDCFYLNYASGAIGMGAAVPPSDSWAVAIEPKTTSQGALIITQNSGNTATIFEIESSAATPEIWIDSSFEFHANNGITINGNNGGSGSIWYCTNFTSPNGNVFSFYKTADSASANLRLRYLNTNTDVFNVDTSADMQFYTAVTFESTVTLQAALTPAVVALTDASTITVNAAQGNVFAVTLGGSRTLGAPSSPVDGQVIRIRVIQPASGGPYALSYNSVYDFGATGQPALSTAASKVDVLGFEYNASLSKWCYLGSGLGF